MTPTTISNRTLLVARMYYLSRVTVNTLDVCFPNAVYWEVVPATTPVSILPRLNPKSTGHGSIKDMDVCTHLYPSVRVPLGFCVRRCRDSERKAGGRSLRTLLDREYDMLIRRA